MCLCVHTSPCVPLLHASEKMELTTLWEWVWLDDVISETPLSDWLEWLDWDSGGVRPQAEVSFELLLLIMPIHLKK